MVACAFWESDTERQDRKLMELLLEHRPPEVKHRPPARHHPHERPPLWEPEANTWEAEFLKRHEQDVEHPEQEKENGVSRAISDWWESMTRTAKEEEARAKRRVRLKAEREAKREQRRQRRAAEAAAALSEPVEIEDWGQQSERNLRSVVQSVTSSWSAAVLGTGKGLGDVRDAAGAAASAVASKLPFVAGSREAEEQEGRIKRAEAEEASETKALRSVEECAINPAETADGSSSSQNWFQELVSKLPWVDSDSRGASGADGLATALPLPPGRDAAAQEAQPQTEEADTLTPEQEEAKSPPWGTASVGFPSSEWWARQEDAGPNSSEPGGLQPPPAAAAAEVLAPGAAEESAMPFVASSESSAEAGGSEMPRRPSDDLEAMGEQELAASEDAEVRAKETAAAPREAPPPTAPGMSEANLVVQVDIEPKQAEAEETKKAGVARLMAKPGGTILATLCMDGWEVNPIDEEEGLYEVLLPSVNYKVPGGSVSIPAPRFVATVRDTFVRNGEYEERLQGDLVLQNGKDILTVELGFPFRTSFKISAAGWTRACIGSKGSQVSVSNHVEIGLQAPKVPGLESILQLFVKNYGTESTVQVAKSLAVGADALPEDPLGDWMESAKGALLGPFRGNGPAAEPETAAAAPEDTVSSATAASSNAVEVADAEQLADSGADAAVGDAAGIAESSASSPSLAEAPAIEEDEVLQKEASAAPREAPPPSAPGMAEANLMVQVDIPPKLVEAEKTKESGVARLMAKPGGTILATLCMDGWEVNPIDESKGLYEVLLPSVNYKVPGGSVSIPAPRFIATVRDTFVRNGEYEERLQGDLVLQNGKDILTVELGFPFRTTFSISAAGWTRACIGSKGGEVSVSNSVEIGLQVPRVPGLESILQLFVKNYGTESTVQVAKALAIGADELPEDPLGDWMESAKDALLGPFQGGATEPEREPAGSTVAPESEPSSSAPGSPREGAEATSDADAASASGKEAGELPEAAVPAGAVEVDAGAADADIAGSEAQAPPVAEVISSPPPPSSKEADEEGDEVAAERLLESQVDPKVPPPSAPGMADANLTVRVDIEPKLAEPTELQEEGVTRLMAQPGGDILALMAREGWEVNPIDKDKGLYEVLLPSVNYKVPGGTVSIPAPRFVATVRDTNVRTGDYLERLQGDLVLQNGKDIVTVELGFPFRTTFAISAAGWCRACIGGEGSKVSVANYVEIGLQVPRVPGLESIMQYFVKSYGTDSTVQVAESLALGADKLPPDLAREFFESAKYAMSGLQKQMPAFPSMGSESPQAPEGAPAVGSSGAPTAEPEASAPLQEAAAEEEEPGGGEPAEAAATAAAAPRTAGAGGGGAAFAAPEAAPARASEAVEAVSPEAVEDQLFEDVQALLDSDDSAPTPSVPGFDDANMVVGLNIVPKMQQAEKNGAEGVACLMAKGGRDLLNTMDERWVITPVDEDKGLYEMTLPAVEYTMSVAKVSIPPPRFLVTVRETFAKSGSYQERLQGDMVLQNGKDIFTVELQVPWRTKFSISAAGWTRARIGWSGAHIVVSNYVEVGLFLPSVPGVPPSFPPGLESTMQYFLKSYGNDSAKQVVEGLARGADSISPEEISMNNFFQSAKTAMSELPRFGSPNSEPLQEGSNPELVMTKSTDSQMSPAPVEDAATMSQRQQQRPEGASSGEAVQDGFATAGVESDVLEECVTVDEGATPGEAPQPTVPGMEQANLVVRVRVEPKTAEAVTTQAEGVARLMAQPGGAILATMAQDGWEVNAVEPSMGIYELLLPPVRFKVPVGVVSIPAPRFLATVRDTCVLSGEHKERLQGDLVLQNGEGILTVELGFPFRTSFSITAAGWARASIGSEGNVVTVGNYIEIGLRLPKVPGLESIMQLFVKSYGAESTQQVADALAKGADNIPLEADLSDWLADAFGKMSQRLDASLHPKALPGSSTAAAASKPSSEDGAADVPSAVGRQP